ncbi:hypothetical protein [Nocardia beijingensis]|uniref:hypothetical protein n=1 Tax=Nocardia beijingensis TaxID=95162 RepID=UPI0012F49DB3|nr:hypothetical protein [Nocardia beijingensis]
MIRAAVLVGLTVALAWPFMVATAIAVNGFGVANPSTTRTVIGWVAEVPWLVFLVVLAWAILTKRAADQPEKK